jgi:hypothetical protein
MARRKAIWLAMLVALTLITASGPGRLTGAQEPSRTFAETGKTIKGKFLSYWEKNGGLAQQGYPISGEMQEKSDTDGKSYTVQYFERAVFEAHPENPAPNDVLLSLLGNFLYKQKYPNGAPNQKASMDSATKFSQTGKSLDGKFRVYWEKNGGLAQQGYPISEEFTEKSDLDGKSYTVQYFERAVFELHTENQPPYDVLLSQLGTFHYKLKYPNGGGTPAPTTIPGTATPLPSTGKAGWSQINAANNGPKARYDHSAVVDPARDQLVIFGGRAPGSRGGTFGDTWVLDLKTRMWREVQGKGPAARFGQGAVLDAANRRLIVVMGEGAGFFNDVWAFDLDKETWTQLKENKNGADAPRTRYGQSAALDGKGRVIISHGFSDQGRFDDTWAFDPAQSSWINLTPAGTKPLKRCLHEMVYDAAADRVILFGGCSSGFGPCPQGDFWAFDLKTNTWKELVATGAKPSPRSNPSLVYDAAGKRIMLYGGQTQGGVSNEVWSYDLAGNSWTKLEIEGTPGGRSSQATAHDPTTRRAIIYGGQTADGPSPEIWEWKF